LTGDARLFFAAWPAPEIQRALGDLGKTLQDECGGRALPARNIHLTLVFLGDIARERLAELEALAAGITAPHFGLDVDRVGYWRHNRVVWAGIARCPDALLLLVQRLEQRLSFSGFRFDRRPYSPHVTLLRNARRAPADATMRTVAWPVARFALVESVPRDRGRAYEVLREWPLGTQMSA
jgi:2'-5' RNA ligase